MGNKLINSRNANSEINANRIIKATLPINIADPMTMSMTHQALIRAFKLSITGDEALPAFFFRINPTDEAKTKIPANIPNNR